MDLDRRAFVAALLAGGIGASQVGPLDRYLDAFALMLSASGTLEGALEMGPIPLVTIVIPLVLGTLGGLSRRIVRDAPARPRE